jgi:cellulose synthase/poly-beta-1,6-N-acetylglucosamine synthase-like glycosyltransferase
MAYNEEANIGQLLDSLLKQKEKVAQIKEIWVIASGCTDKTVDIVKKYQKKSSRVKLLEQKKREGKASAINLWLKYIKTDICVMESADTMPRLNTIDEMIKPFRNELVGMTGGHPIPVNSSDSFMGFAVNKLWELHHYIALKTPKCGEIIAFRKIFKRIPPLSSADEANVEPLIIGQAYTIAYCPNAIIKNRGPETVREYLKRRRSTAAGHLAIQKNQGYRVSTMSGLKILGIHLRHMKFDKKHLFWMPAIMFIEAYGRFLGYWDFRFRKRSHAIWDIAQSTKKLGGTKTEETKVKNIKEKYA